MNADELSKKIKMEAGRLGFLYCGISKAGFLEDEAPRLQKWLKEGRHGQMSYMENHFDKRLDPTKLVEGSKSVISVALNYHSPEKQRDSDAPKISSYAFGRDYHHVIKEKLTALMNWMYKEIGQVEGRAFVDSAPIMDKAWAKKSGLGWIGKHTNLINKKSGSYFFLAELVLDLELTPDSPQPDHCGTCTRCIDACPTEAITHAYLLDASKCISYLTIELKDEIPEEFRGKLDNNMFGCDICQQVCPWNRFSLAHQEPAFDPTPALLHMTRKDWEEITEDVFKMLFKDSAVKRTKFKGLQRNIAFLSK